MPIPVLGDEVGIVEPITALSLLALPGQKYGTFPIRTALVELALDPGVWTWTGKTPTITERLILDPGDWFWKGRQLAGGVHTQLGLLALSRPRIGVFPTRTPSTALPLDPASWTWTGSALTANGILLAPGVWTWAGSELVVSRPKATQLSLLALPGRPVIFADKIQAVAMDPGVWTWTGQVPRVVEALRLAPAEWTWVGQEPTIPTTITLAPASWAWTGQDPEIHVLSNVPISPGSWAWAGQELVVGISQPLQRRRWRIFRYRLS